MSGCRRGSDRIRIVERGRDVSSDPDVTRSTFRAADGRSAAASPPSPASPSGSFPVGLPRQAPGPRIRRLRIAPRPGPSTASGTPPGSLAAFPVGGFALPQSRDLEGPLQSPWPAPPWKADWLFMQSASSPSATRPKGRRRRACCRPQRPPPHLQLDGASAHLGQRPSWTATSSTLVVLLRPRPPPRRRTAPSGLGPPSEPAPPWSTATLPSSERRPGLTHPSACAAPSCWGSAGAAPAPRHLVSAPQPFRRVRVGWLVRGERAAVIRLPAGSALSLLRLFDDAQDAVLGPFLARRLRAA